MMKRQQNYPTKSLMALDDLRSAIEDLRLAIDDQTLFRRRWVTVATLMRSIGNVLHEVDSENDQRIKEVNAALWPEKKESRIFKFICSVRGTTVKQYRSQIFDIRADESPMSVYANTSAMTTYETEHSSDTPALTFPDERIPLFERLREIVNWWQEYLDEIQSKASSG